MKFYEEMQFLVDDAVCIQGKLEDIENGEEKDTPLSTVAQDLAELAYECVKLRIEVLNENDL